MALHVSAPAPGPPLSSTAGLRATWLPVSYGSSSESDMDDTFAALAGHGVSRVYVDVWNNGVAYMASPTLTAFCGDACIGDDHLAWAVAAGAKHGVEVAAWLEYGLMAAYSSVSANAFAPLAADAGWVLGTESSFVWMDPTSGAADLVAGLAADAAAGYPSLVAVQVDDHFACPAALACSSAGVTSAAKALWTAVRATGSKVPLSVAPNPISTSLSAYNADWPAWLDSGFFTEAVPQLYRSDSASFDQLLDEQLAQLSAAQAAMMACGLRAVGTGADTPWDDLAAMMDTAAADDLGVVVWYATAILDVYSSEFESVWL